MAKNPNYEKPKQSLKELEKRYRDLFNSISDLIMIHDLEGRLLNVILLYPSFRATRLKN